MWCRDPASTADDNLTTARINPLPGGGATPPTMPPIARTPLPVRRTPLPIIRPPLAPRHDCEGLCKTAATTRSYSCLLFCSYSLLLAAAKTLLLAAAKKDLLLLKYMWLMSPKLRVRSCLSKKAPNAPKRAQESPREPKIASRWSQDGPIQEQIKKEVDGQRNFDF